MAQIETVRRVGRTLDWIGLVLLVVIGALGTLYWWVTRPPPGLDGRLHLPGLEAGVTITRDTLGVPHIEAANLHDLIFAEGYAMAQDRLWQMDAGRRYGEGTLSEVFGAATVATDRRTRTLGLDRVVAAEAARLAPADRAELEAFSAGVNACEAGLGCHLPLDFWLLRYRPQPWRPEDSLAFGAYMYEVLGSDYLTKLEREDFAAQLPAALEAELFPDRSPWDIIPGAPEPGAPAPRSAARVGGPFPTFLVNLCKLGVPETSGAGSNNWALAGARTMSGKPLLANDPHLAYSVPGIWWAAELTAPELHVAGVTMAGVPGILIGHNDHIAWGITAARADLQDLYREAPLPARTWHETIKVRGGAEVRFEVPAGAHGPVVARDGGGSLALSWTLYAPGSLAENTAILGLDQARDWNEFEAALARLAGPSLSFVYADTAGHIGFQLAGWIPMRAAGVDGSVPLPGGDPKNAWRGWIPFAQLPHAYDPAKGELVTANSRLTPDDYPYTVSTVWDAPNRTRRIYQLLDQLPRWNASAMARLQTDVFSEQDRDFAAALLAAAQTQTVTSASTQQALTILRGFRGGMGRSTMGPTLAFETRQEFLLRVLTARVGAELARSYRWDEAPVFEQRLLTARPAEWLPAAYKDRGWDALLLDCLTAVAGRHQLNYADLHWGKLETLEVEHPVWSSLPLLKKVADLGPVEINGSPQTVKQARSTWLGDATNLGPSMRFVADLDDWDRSTLNLFAGESGDIASPHYRDQFSDYLLGKPLPLWYSPQAVAAHRQHRIELLP